MNKLIIIGNGFDLHHGLPTDYGSFIKWHLIKVLTSCNVTEINKSNFFVISFKKLTNWPTNLEKDIPNIIGNFLENYSNKFETKIIFNSVAYELNIKTINPFVESLLRNIKDLKWVDIEMEYFNHLKILLKEYNGGNDKNFVLKKLHSLNNTIQSLIEELEVYLIEISLRREADRNFEAIASDPIKSKLILEKHHLKNIDAKIKDYSKLSYIEPKNVLILNFNYTNLTKYFSSNDKNFIKINIHGSINSKFNTPVFGFGDEVCEEYLEMEKTNVNEFLKYAKSFAYSQNSNYSDLISFLDSDSYFVQIWGHSCALSDRTLLNMIFEHNNCAAIQPYYWKKNETEDNYNEIIQNLSRHFKNKQKFRQRLVNKQDCRPL